ncbi:hypothetical protein BJX62DRAFT_214428 [Aspergillus germanicus]
MAHFHNALGCNGVIIPRCEMDRLIPLCIRNCRVRAVAEQETEYLPRHTGIRDCDCEMQWTRQSLVVKDHVCVNPAFELRLEALNVGFFDDLSEELRDGREGSLALALRQDRGISARWCCWVSRHLWLCLSDGLRRLYVDCAVRRRRRRWSIHRKWLVEPIIVY